VRRLGESSIVYSGTPGRESFGAYRVDVNGKRTRVGRRNGRSANVPFDNGALLYSQLDFVNPYQERSDLWVQRGGSEHQLTHGQRLATPDARASDALIVATQVIPGATRLVLVSRDGKSITPITHGSYDEQWTEPRWSHDGKHIAASRWLRGNVSQIVVIDTTREAIAVAEAKRLKIPTVAIVDTNADPELISYPIAGNDDAIRAIRIVLQKLVDAMVSAQTGRTRKDQEALAGVSE